MRSIIRQCLTLGVVLTGVCVSPTFSLSAVYGQSTMPAGWEQLSPGEFLEASQSLFDAAGPSDAHRKEIVAHAWNTILSQEGLIASEDWSVVEGLFTFFGPQRDLLVEGETEEERTVSAKAMHVTLKAINSRIQTRLKTDADTVAGVSYDDMIARKIALGKSLGLRIWRLCDSFAAWMDANDWKSLSLDKKAHLLQSISHTHLHIKRWECSFRWTGSIEVPETDQFTFEQACSCFSNGIFKLWIDGKLVLDNSSVPPYGAAKVASDSDALAPFRSEPVTLTAGSKTPIRIEYVYDKARQGRPLRYPNDFPLVVLTWKSAQIEKQIVPSSAFSPPDGIGTPGDQGLQGEYFDGVSFQKLVKTRIDPQIDFVWQRLGIFGLHEAKINEILADCRSQIMGEVPLDSQQGSLFMQRAAAWFADGMDATDRSRFASSLVQRPQLLAETKPSELARLFRVFHMLPGDEHLDLLAAWAEARPQPRFQIQDLSVTGTKLISCRHLNYMPLKEFANWMRGPSSLEEASDLLENSLERSDGECNLAIVHVLAWWNRFYRFYRLDQETTLSQHLDEVLDDPALTGDRRVTWLIGRGIAAEIAATRANMYIGLRKALPYLEEAMLVAESPEYQFWALQEMVGHLLYLRQTDRADELLGTYGARFSTPAEQATFAAWKQTGEAEVARSRNAKAKHRERAAKRAQKAYLAELRRRRQRKVDAGADVSRYDTLIKASSATNVP